MKGDFVEETQGGFFAMKYAVKERLFHGQSDFQKVEIVRTAGHGKMLLNDGIVMVTEKDEFIYHEMISHVALFTHPHPQKILIIGGGDGGTAREVLRHSSVEKCVMVEIDGMVVEACREHLPQMSRSLDNPRLELLIADGVQYLSDCQESYDVILVDSTDPIGPAQPLFGPKFYQDVLRCLGPEGIVVSQGESIFYERETQRKLMSILSEIFPLTSIYNYQNLTYPGSPWSFTFGSKGPHPLGDFNPCRLKESGLEFQYYNEFIHRAAFALPTHQRQYLVEYIKLQGEQ